MIKSVTPKTYGTHIGICREQTSKNTSIQAVELGDLTTLFKMKPIGIPYHKIPPEIQLAAYFMHIATSISLARLATYFSTHSHEIAFEAIEQLRDDPDQNHILDIYETAIANWTKTFEAKL